MDAQENEDTFRGFNLLQGWSTLCNLVQRRSNRMTRLCARLSLHLKIIIRGISEFRFFAGSIRGCCLTLGF